MSASKQRGTAWETAVVRFLQDCGHRYAERRALNGSRDLGDITGIPGVVIECKSQNRITLAEWIDETETERLNAEAELAVCWVKRKGKSSPGHGYVVMTGLQFAYLLRQITDDGR